METIIRILGIILFTIVTIGVCSFLTAIIVYWLWNWLMPTLFGLPTVSYIQAWGICWLCGCLFKGNYSQHKTE